MVYGYRWVYIVDCLGGDKIMEQEKRTKCKYNEHSYMESNSINQYNDQTIIYCTKCGDVIKINNGK